MTSRSRTWTSRLECFDSTICFCVFLVVLAQSCHAQTPLTIEDLELDPRGESRVVFTCPVTNPGVRIDADQRLKMRPYRTDDGSYMVYVAFDKTTPAVPPTDINYYLYSQPTTATDKELFTEYVIVGTPRGDFSDQWTKVRFRLNENGSHRGSLELPVHSFSNASLISVDADPLAGVVYLSDTNHKVSFAAKSLLKGLDVYVDSADLTTNNEDFWEWGDSKDRYAVTFDHSAPGPPFQIRTTSLSGAARVQPRLWKSLFASARSLKPDQSQDVMMLTVRHSAGMGGTPRALSVPINIQFRPPWWSLLAGAIIGAVLGSALTLFFPKTWKATTPIRTIGSAILLAMIAEILGMLMFISEDSKLEIANLNLNPSELLPSLGLGILVGLCGLKVLDSFNIPLPTR